MERLQAILPFLQERLPDFLEDLRVLVNLDCGTSNKAGVDAAGRIFRERLELAGAVIEQFPLETFGDCLLATWHGSGRARILLSGHLDTVYPDGTAAARPMRTEGNRILGPGVADMKSGLLAGLYAIRALQASSFQDFAEIHFFANTDEEVDSPASRSIYQPLAVKMDAALVLEAARANGDIVSARKGCSSYRLNVHGRQAHAGVEPEKGANAILELARCIQEISALHQPSSGTTVNVGVIGGGTRSNVVPDLAWAEVDARFLSAAAGRSLDLAIREIIAQTSVAGTRVELEGGIQKGPMEKSPATAYLVDLAFGIAFQLGFSFKDVQSGGTSDGNFIGELGVPTLDGLGPVGGLDHSPGEFLEPDTIVPRTAMVAGLVEAIATNLDRIRSMKSGGV